jgi:hypothetical protein
MEDLMALSEKALRLIKEAKNLQKQAEQELNAQRDQIVAKIIELPDFQKHVRHQAWRYIALAKRGTTGPLGETVELPSEIWTALKRLEEDTEQLHKIMNQ